MADSKTPLVDEIAARSTDLHTFMERALQPEIYQRKGQRFMNCLRIYRPDLATRFSLDESLGRVLDPFFNDEALPGAIEWVRDNWENKPKC